MDRQPWDSSLSSGLDLESNNAVTGAKVIIALQQRMGKKTLTLIYNLNPKLDFKKVLRELRKEFQCNGTIIDSDEFGAVIQLQGNQVEKSRDWLVTEGIVTVENITTKGVL